MFVGVSPGFFETMRIDQVDGRDFRPGDLPPRLSDSAQPLPGVGIINEAFARACFSGKDPVGGKDLYQRIVERYHGRIRVESEPGVGSTFQRTLLV